MTTTSALSSEKKRNSKARRFIDRYKLELSIGISFLIQLLILFFWYVPPIEFDNKLDRLVEEVAFVDSVSIKEPEVAEPDDGEFEVTDKKKEIKKVDPRISSAQDSILSGATQPIDLSPNLKPEYTAEAKAAGIEGRMTLEVIIADTGEVLQVRSVGRKLGYGLEEAAKKAFSRKRYSPAILDGKPITVKALIPVNWSLR